MSDISKIAIVTGAGSGIGRASALALLADGWSVVLAGRREEALADTMSEAGPMSAKALPMATDVTDPNSVKDLFNAAKTKFGRLDFLFNNAGGGSPPDPFEDISLETWQRVLNVNLTGPFLCSQEAFRIMKDQSPRGGRIVNNGSISAHVPRPFSAPYTSTKHAITGLTKATSLDGRAYDICVGQIDIGNAATPMTQRMQTGVLQPDGTTRIEATMDVKAVADAIVYMANLPLDANVHTMTVMASKMPYIGRG